MFKIIQKPRDSRCVHEFLFLEGTGNSLKMTASNASQKTIFVKLGQIVLLIICFIEPTT